MSVIKLNLINKSANTQNNNFIVFQKNASDTFFFNESVVAWQVIKSLSKGEHYEFLYSEDFSVGAKLSNGNIMPAIPAYYRNTYEVAFNRLGHVLQASSTPSINPYEIEIWNNLDLNAVDAHIYRNDSLLAIKNNIQPSTRANFKFLPKLYIGVVSNINQGDILSPSVHVQLQTELNIGDLTKADIIITDDKYSRASPIKFTLINRTHEYDLHKISFENPVITNPLYLFYTPIKQWP